MLCAESWWIRKACLSVLDLVYNLDASTSFRAPIVGMYHMLIVNSDGRVDGTSRGGYIKSDIIRRGPSLLVRWSCYVLPSLTICSVGLFGYWKTPTKWRTRDETTRDLTLEASGIFLLIFLKWRPSEVLPPGAREFGDQFYINSWLHQYELRVRVILT